MDSFPELYNLWYEEHGKGKMDVEKAAWVVKETAYLSKLRDNGLLEPKAATAIEAVCVWDTVAFHKIRFSASWVPRLLDMEREGMEIHNAELSPKIKYGFHALALDETRNAFKPTLWQMPKQAPTAHGVTSDGATFRLLEMKQVWFSGKHSHVGGGYS
jgi:hypothetical protein